MRHLDVLASANTVNRVARLLLAPADWQTMEAMEALEAAEAADDASLSGSSSGSSSGEEAGEGAGSERSGGALELSEEAAERRRRTRENYSVRKKRELIALAQVNGVREVCRAEGIPRRTLRQWMKDADKINSFEGPDSRKSIGRSGRREILPFARELAAFLKEKRRQRQVRAHEWVSMRTLRS